MCCAVREWGGILDGCFPYLFMKVVSGEGDDTFFFFKNAKDGASKFFKNIILAWCP